MRRPERANRPATPTPLTSEGNLCRDRNGDKSGTRGSFDGEAGWERKLEKAKGVVERELQKLELREAKERERAVKKIAALRQKNWESSRDYGKRATKLQAKLMDDNDDDPWLVECFISGIYKASRRRRVRSEFQKSNQNWFSLKAAIDCLRHWRRLPHDDAYDLESKSDNDTTSDESDEASNSYQPRRLTYIRLDTISPSILSDARAFDRFLDENNFLPDYQPSGPYSFESILQLQSTSRKLASGVDIQGASEPSSTTTNSGGPHAVPGTRMQKLCPFLYEILSDSESEVTETFYNKIELEPATGQVAAADVVRGQLCSDNSSASGIVEPMDVSSKVILTSKCDMVDDPAPNDAPCTMKHVDNTLPVSEIPKQIIIHPEHSEDNQSMPKPLLVLFRELEIPEKVIDAVRGKCVEGGVHQNTTGENKMEKWREKLSVGEELENEEAIMVVYSAEGAGDPGQECEIGADSDALEEAQLETRSKVENRPLDTGMHFQVIAGVQRRSTLDEHSTGNHDGEGGFLGASSGPEERQNWGNALELVEADLQETHDPGQESTPVGQKAADEQASGISARESISPFYRRTKTREKPVQEDGMEKDEYRTAGWLPRRDNEQIYRKSDNALLMLNQRLEEGYSLARARLRMPEPLRAADNDVFAQQATTSPRAIHHERATTRKTFRECHPYHFITTSGQPIMGSLADEELRIAREWKPGGTGRIVVRLPVAVTGVRGQKTGATEEDTGIGDWLGERQRGSQEVVEEIAGRGRLHTDVRRSGFSFQTSGYGVRWSHELQANGKEIQNLSWSVEVQIARACGVASSWVLSESCGDIFCIMYYSRWLWDPGGSAPYFFLALVLLPTGT